MRARVARMFVWLERFVLVNIVDRLILAASIRKFYRIAAGHIYFQSLAAAVELDLFTILRAEGPMRLKQVASRLALDEQPCRILLQVLTATGVLTKRADTFRNSLMSEIAFSKQNPRSLSAIILWQKYIVYKPMARMLESLKGYSNEGLKRKHR